MFQLGSSWFQLGSGLVPVGFQLGRGANWSVNEVAQMMGITPVYRPGKKGEARNTLNQDDSAQKILGWKPERNLKDYLDETLST